MEYQRVARPGRGHRVDRHLLPGGGGDHRVELHRPRLVHETARRGPVHVAAHDQEAIPLGVVDRGVPGAGRRKRPGNRQRAPGPGLDGAGRQVLAGEHPRVVQESPTPLAAEDDHPPGGDRLPGALSISVESGHVPFAGRRPGPGTQRPPHTVPARRQRQGPHGRVGQPARLVAPAEHEHLRGVVRRLRVAAPRHQDRGVAVASRTAAGRERQPAVLRADVAPHVAQHGTSRVQTPEDDHGVAVRDG